VSLTKLKPIIAKESYEEKIERVISYALYQSIFKPILDILGYRKDRHGDIKRNSDQNALEAAIETGKVVYDKGAFRGQFSAAISAEIKRLGGVWDNAAKAYRLPSKGASVPAKAMISKASAKTKADLDHINALLDQFEYVGIEPVPLLPFVDSIIDDLHAQLKKTVPADYELGMAMSGYIEDKIKTDYTNNMDLNIKKWADEQVVRLREVVQENSAQGYRSGRLIEQIQAEYGVTANKAAFLARQETSLLVSKYRESNYKEAGIQAYQWSTSHDARVRDTHRELNGRIFTWDKPPIVDLATGRRAHPGEDWNCRCVAIPVITRQLQEVGA
jgi:SPP1 gp7 family putative phage head morphogenesis protein